jgi:predicted peptidase
MKKLLFILLMFISLITQAQFLPTDIKEFTTDGPLKMRAKYWSPLDTTRYPLLVFLHGIGETHPTDLNRVLKYGPLVQISVLKWNLGELKVIVQPQNPKDQWSVGEIDEVIEYCKKTYPVDPDRIYLMGASLGGYGVWTYAQSAEHVKKLAAIVPLCAGGNDPSKAWIIAKDGVPGWASHAANDGMVSYKTGKRMVDAVNVAANKSQIRFTEVGVSGHSIWNQFLKPEHGVWEWLKYQRLSDRAKPKKFDFEKLKITVLKTIEEMRQEMEQQ